MSPSEQQDSRTILEFLQENINSWKKKDKSGGKDRLAGSSDDVEELKRNLFQQDSEAQFIDQDDMDDAEYGEEGDEDDEGYGHEWTICIRFT